MFVYIGRSGHPLDGYTQRPTLVAVCVPQTIFGHLPGLFYKMKEEFFGREGVVLNPSEILTQSVFDELVKAKRNPDILKKLDLIDKIFLHLSCNPILRPITIFAVIIERPDFEFQYKQPGQLPSDFWFLLQRVDRLEEEQGGKESGAILFFEEESFEIKSDPTFIADFAQVIYNTQKQLKQLRYINPGLHKAKPDWQAEPGLIVAKLVAEIVRLAHEEGLGWEGTFREREWLSSLHKDYLRNTIDKYYSIICGRSRDWLESGQEKLYGFFLMKADKFPREESKKSFLE